MKKRLHPSLHDEQYESYMDDDMYRGLSHGESAHHLGSIGSLTPI